MLLSNWLLSQGPGTILRPIGMLLSNWLLSQGPGITLASVMGQFEHWLRQFEALWETLDEIDTKCWVLEPEKPTRACTYRRVVIGEDTLMWTP